MCEQARISEFDEQLCLFLKEWAQPLDKRCKGNTDPQVRAAYYVWARYTMSIRTVAHLYQPEFIPDLFVIARCCLEYYAALKAVLSKLAIAEQYLDFEKCALASYKRYLEGEGQTEKVTEVCGMLKEMGVEDCDKYKSRGWCKNGYAALIRDYGESGDSLLYRQLSDFVHGSIVSLRFLKRQSPSANQGLQVRKTTCLGHIVATKEFLDKVWGASEDTGCEAAFVQVAKSLS